MSKTFKTYFEQHTIVLEKNEQYQVLVDELKKYEKELSEQHKNLKQQLKDQQFLSSEGMKYHFDKFVNQELKRRKIRELVPAKFSTTAGKDEKDEKDKKDKEKSQDDLATQVKSNMRDASKSEAYKLFPQKGGKDTNIIDVIVANQTYLKWLTGYKQDWSQEQFEEYEQKNTELIAKIKKDITFQKRSTRNNFMELLFRHESGDFENSIAGQIIKGLQELKKTSAAESIVVEDDEQKSDSNAPKTIEPGSVSDQVLKKIIEGNKAYLKAFEKYVDSVELMGLAFEKRAVKKSVILKTLGDKEGQDEAGLTNDDVKIIKKYINEWKDAITNLQEIIKATKIGKSSTGVEVSKLLQQHDKLFDKMKNGLEGLTSESDIGPMQAMIKDLGTLLTKLKQFDPDPDPKKK